MRAFLLILSINLCILSAKESYGANYFENHFALNDVVNGIEELYQLDKKLINTPTYFGLATAEIMTYSVMTCSTFGPWIALCRTGCSFIEIRGTSWLLSVTSLFLPEQTQETLKYLWSKLFTAILASEFYFDPTITISKYAFAFAGIYMANQLFSDKLANLTEWQKLQIKAFVYFCFKKLGITIAGNIRESIYEIVSSLPIKIEDTDTLFDEANQQAFHEMVDGSSMQVCSPEVSGVYNETQIIDKYAINLLWINEKPFLPLCSRHLFMDYLSGECRLPFKKLFIFGSTEDELHNKISDSVLGWARENPGVKINFWFDGKMVPDDIVQNTKDAFIARSGELNHSLIHFRNIHELLLVIKNQENFSPKSTDVWIRCDLAREVISNELVKRGECLNSVYADLDVVPTSEKNLFDESTVKKLETIGLVYDAASPYYNMRTWPENSFHILAEKGEELHRKHVINRILQIKSSQRWERNIVFSIISKFYKHMTKKCPSCVRGLLKPVERPECLGCQNHDYEWGGDFWSL